MTDWGTLPDLASRRVGGSVVWANDESFAERENLIKPAAPVFQPSTFGHKGQIYDGWETRRRREDGADQAVIRLGLPGIVAGVEVDTAFFTGNYPPFCSVEGCAVEGYPSPAELADADWQVIVPRAPLLGDARNQFPSVSGLRYTHVRLTIYPDGGVARLRAHGEPVPDPRFVDFGALDLAALANGAAISGCSNRFYSSPANLISPGFASVMGEGWETARRRDSANDWVSVQLTGLGTVRLIELDTTHFKGNAPGWASVSGYADGTWVPILDRVRLQPDTRHRFRVSSDYVSAARLDVYPDGGMARLRMFGTLSVAGRERTVLRWFNALPVAYATEVLADFGVPAASVDEIVASRPVAAAPWFEDR